ncbi:hypothetical protein B7494_g1848 [Chlorociboria aeruginascens]|nr:hypothetical protein B7494_g1848 [Chlorociboria aeruginascens]
MREEGREGVCLGGEAKLISRYAGSLQVLPWALRVDLDMARQGKDGHGYLAHPPPLAASGSHPFAWVIRATRLVSSRLHGVPKNKTHYSCRGQNECHRPPVASARQDIVMVRLFLPRETATATYPVLLASYQTTPPLPVQQREITTRDRMGDYTYDG